MILAFVTAAAAAQAQIPTAACPEVVTSQAFVCRALQASNAGKPEAAAQAFEQAANAQSEDESEKARLWAAAGNMWIAANQAGKAAFALDKALSGTGLQAEQRGEALLDRARAAEAQNDLKTARSKVTEAARMVPEDPFLWYFSAALAIREGDAVTAKNSIGKALTLEPSNPTVLFEAGHVYHFAGELAAARNYWTRASAVDPGGKSGQAAREALALLDKPVPVQSEPTATK
jgi:Flp pilus assembly protein TadD